MTRDQIITRNKAKIVAEEELRIEIEQQRNKFLTESMDKCWHEKLYWPDPNTTTCVTCGATGKGLIRLDFTSYEVFGIFIGWLLAQDWFFSFWEDILEDVDTPWYECHSGCSKFNIKYLEPDNLFNAAYSYMKKLENEV